MKSFLMIAVAGLLASAHCVQAQVDPNKAEVLANDPTSDLSRLSDAEIKAVSVLGAKAYYNKHPHEYSDQDLELANKQGLQHNLAGHSLDVYRANWLLTVEAVSVGNHSKDRDK